MDNQTAINTLSPLIAARTDEINSLNVAMTILTNGFQSDTASIAAIQAQLDTANAALATANANLDTLRQQITDLGGTPSI